MEANRTGVVTEDIAAVIARLQAAYSRHDAAAIAAQYAEDCIVDSPVAGVHKGRPAVEKAFLMIFASFPDLELVAEELLIFGNRAVWMNTAQGTDTGGLMGLSPTGKPFSTATIFLFTFDHNHKVLRERRIYDFSRLLLHLAGEAQPATEGRQLYREMLERARRDHELQIAAEIQRALLPASHYLGKAFEVAATSVPCRAIGGDFFDYYHLPRNGFAFVLGDVAGKGPAAALLASLLQGIFTANAFRDGTPAGFVTLANDALVRRAVEARFATAIYAMLDRRGRLTYCNAGHNPPFLVSRSGIRRLDWGGMIVGAFEHATFEEDTQQLWPGDVLVAYSDGVTEARDASDEEFGEERLLSCVQANCTRSPVEIVECLLSAVHEFSAGTTQSDDITMLVLRYTG
jgi:serine phosphatase RsbU (regulator of sigma subunit)/predicted ester cyclase